jgi:hypothetical protein
MIETEEAYHMITIHQNPGHNVVLKMLVSLFIRDKRRANGEKGYYECETM